MTDRKLFRDTFDKLHASPEILTEVLNMTSEKNIPSAGSSPVSVSDAASSRRTSRRRGGFRAAAAAAAIFLILGTGTAAYAADAGGIQRMVQLWLHGDQTNAVLTMENDGKGSYTLDYTDAEGQEHQIHGGGITIEADGTEWPVTEEEILEHLRCPDVEHRDDGTIWVYCADQSIEITDRFEDGICYVQVKDGDLTWYMTISLESGYGMSTTKYPSAREVLH